MVQALDHVYYWVQDMDRAVAFYRDTLGLKLVRQDGQAWALLDAGADVKLALHGLVEGRPFEPGGAAAVFRVEDLDAARADLGMKGVVFDENMGEVADYARFASFKDPDGNTVQIIEYSRKDG